MYTVAALINSTEITSCSFPAETAGGDDTTVGRRQSSHSLLCDAPRLGRHSRYMRAGLLNNLITLCRCVVTFWEISMFVVSNKCKREVLLNKVVCGVNNEPVLVILQPFRRRCLSSTRWWVIGCAVLNKEPTLWCGWPCPEQQVQLAAVSSSKVSCDLSPRPSYPSAVDSTVWQTLFCRPSACFRPPALGLDTQLQRRHRGFHESAGCSGQSYPVTIWCTARTQWTIRNIQD